MLLAIDVGNTETTVGIFQGEEMVAHWRFSTARNRTPDEYRLLLTSTLAMEGFETAGLTGTAIASVVPLATDALRRVAQLLVDGPLIVVEPGVKTGIPILIDQPKEVGADRVVNAAAAIVSYGAPVVVVDFGTATTFDVVSAGGEYIGGSIAPGLQVSLESLVRATAALRRVELHPPRSVVGKGTVEAIQSGILYGYAGLVDGILARIRRELGEGTASVATGGLASTIVPHCTGVREIDEFLTLRGLRLIYDRNT